MPVLTRVILARLPPVKLVTVPGFASVALGRPACLPRAHPLILRGIMLRRLGQRVLCETAIRGRHTRNARELGDGGKGETIKGGGG